MLITDRRLARVGAFQAGDPDLERRFVDVSAGRGEALAARDRTAEDVRIDEGGEHTGLRRSDAARRGDLHRADACFSARAVFTCARCMRNSGEAWISPSASTPSAARAAACAIDSG